jgi:AraC family transcriptional regulator, exoenzyme S synthesis regulatory protein ExsA
MSGSDPSLNHIQQAALIVKQAIDNNPLSRLNINKLVPNVRVGRNQLQSAFKQLTSQTIKRYRLIKRMEAARNMLVMESESVKEVAFKCGYKNQGNFNTDFKNVYSKTPGEWMKENYKHRYNGDMNTNKVHSS